MKVHEKKEATPVGKYEKSFLQVNAGKKIEVSAGIEKHHLVDAKNNLL